MDNLPKLPGLTFEDRFKSSYGLPKTFEIINGFYIPLPLPNTNNGTDLPAHKSVGSIESIDHELHEPTFYYGSVKQPYIEPFRPKFVIFDKMALTFKAFFRQSVPESPDEHHRIRHVNIIYFLEDDTIKIMEPCVKNSGLQHGLLVRRGKVAKNIKGEIYTWKDFNIGIDIEINGIVFHIVDCDQFTKDFLESQGVELNDVEVAPVDPVTCEKTIQKFGRTKSCSETTHHEYKLKRFLEFQGKVLRFDCILDETDRPEGEVKRYQLFYYLEDDTVSIKEIPEKLGVASERSSMLLRRTKLPKNWKKRPTNFPSIYMETTDDEVEEYYEPKDFQIGETIFVFGRRFLLLDCDKCTRKYYNEVLKQPQGEPLSIKFEEKKQIRRKTPDYLGIGTPEDSIASHYHLRPKPPKRDIKKYIMNANKFLRYGCILDTAHPEDKIRKFILSYSLADDTISIMEPPIRNSGIIGGKFLNSQRVMLPNCNKNEPQYYEPRHFYIGALLTINNHRFKIISADYFVYKYMKEHPELFSSEAIQDVQRSLLLDGKLNEDIRQAIQNDIQQECAKQKSKIDERIAGGTDKFNAQYPIKQSPISDIEKCLENIELQENVKSKSSNQTLGNMAEYKYKDQNSLKCSHRDSTQSFQ